MEQQLFFTVGQLAKKMNTTVRTIQYYDKQGLLSPSGRTEGGRRLYNEKDMAKLHQILSLKSLGFSLEEIKNELLPLDSPQQVMEVLDRQRVVIEEQIKELGLAQRAIEKLQQEIKKSNRVSFSEYSKIIMLLRLQTTDLWVKPEAFSERLQGHIKENYDTQDSLDTGDMWYAFDTYQRVAKGMLKLKNAKTKPDSKEAQKLAKEFWDMILEFTKGDMSLLPDLISFNQNKNEWSQEMVDLQSSVEDFMGDALQVYVASLNMGDLFHKQSEEQ